MNLLKLHRLSGCAMLYGMSETPLDESSSSAPQLNSEVEMKAALRELVTAYEGLIKQFEETFIQSDLENTEAFRDLMDAWGKLFEKIIVIDGVIFGASLTPLGFIVNSLPQHQIPWRSGIFLLISWLLLFTSFCSSGIQVMYVVAQKSRRFMKIILPKMLPSFSSALRPLANALKAARSLPDSPSESERSRIILERAYQLADKFDGKQVQELQQKMAMPSMPPARIMILGWGPPLISMALILVFVAMSLFQW